MWKPWRVGECMGRVEISRKAGLRFHEDFAVLELYVPRYIGEWLEKLSKDQRSSVRSLVRKWLIDDYEAHVERARRR